MHGERGGDAEGRGPDQGKLLVYGIYQGSPNNADLTALGVPNQAPVGGIPLSLTEGRGYGALVWAFDPNNNVASRIRMHIPAVVTRETDSNYHWADMPAFTGHNRHDATVFLAQLPAGTHEICFDALDNDLNTWHSIGCRTHTVK